MRSSRRSRRSSDSSPRLHPETNPRAKEQELTYEPDVRVTGLTPNLPVADIDAARGFYTDYLGLNEEEMNLGWVARFRSQDGRASVQLVTRDASSPQGSVISVHVGNDVDEAYTEAQRRGYEIVHPLTDEPWGVRRFLVRAPDGNVINVVSHRDE